MEQLTGGAGQSLRRLKQKADRLVRRDPHSRLIKVRRLSVGENKINTQHLNKSGETPTQPHHTANNQVVAPGRYFTHR